MSEHTPEPWTIRRKNLVRTATHPWVVRDEDDVDRGHFITRPDAEAYAAAPDTKRLLAELVAAAEPFADVIQIIPPYLDGMSVAATYHGDGRGMHMLVEHFRRLAAAVAATKGE